MKWLAVMAVAGLAACGDDVDFTGVAPVGSSLTVVTTSNNQTAMVGTALASPLSVQVRDQNGNLVAGVPVTWTVVGTGGTLSGASSSTDANGVANVNWTLGNTAGLDSVTAMLANGQSVTFVATGTAASFATLSLVGGNSQNVVAGSVTQPLQLRAVDQFGNPVSGVTINWATTGGGTLSATSSTTDASGMAQVTLTTNGTAGPYTVTASSGTATPITFSGSGT